MHKLVIIGASGHGKMIADIAALNGYDKIVFLDDNPVVKEVDKYEVMGGRELSLDLSKQGYDFIVGIGNASIREKIQNELKSLGCNLATLVHPSAVIAYDVKMGSGSVVMAGAVLNAGTTIGNGCIINTSASVDHDNVIGDYSHISVGAHTAGTVEIGARCWLGIGAVVSNNIKICDDVIIGAGAAVIKSISEQGTFVGIPAMKLR